MTVTCDTVRRAFGEFQCCTDCHCRDAEFMCCEAVDVLEKNDAMYDPDGEPTHPALLRAIEEQDA